MPTPWLNVTDLIPEQADIGLGMSGGPRLASV
jgi:hypothetical protein